MANSNFAIHAQAFFEAVACRDADRFIACLSPETFALAVLPDGSRYETLPGFLETQEAWFASTTGTFEFVVQESRECEGLGYIGVLADYTPAAGAEVHKIYISAVFERKNTQWMLACLQNTLLK